MVRIFEHMAPRSGAMKASHQGALMYQAILQDEAQPTGHCMKSDLDTFMARDEFLIGHQKMDLIHEEFYELLTQLNRSTQADAAAALMALIVHCEDHFGQEDRWMRETQYNGRDCHIKEHGEVLASLEDVHSRLVNGDHRALPHLIEALTNWFPGHVQHLDSSLAQWLTKQQWNAHPLVLRRGAVPSRQADH